jgi:hypothetical protein
MSLIINVIFGDIVSLKLAQNASSSFESWFRKWWNDNDLHKIKSKSLSIQRYGAASESNVRTWFDDFKSALTELKIRRRNLINFDETEVRVECSEDEDIIVPEDIKEFYSVSSENRRSVTVVEMINAVDDYSSSLMIIIQRQEIMTSWFSSSFSADTHIVSSSSDFTSDQIAVEFLKHYIKHSDAESNAEWKLMLMNNHDSHRMSEFIKLANENHIRPFSFIPYLTHCMQSLDVRIFQSYKKWHDTIIKEAVTSSYARNVLLQAKDMSKKLISSSVVSRVMTTSSSRAWRLLLASYDSQSSTIKALRFFLFEIHFRTWKKIRAKRFKQKAKRSIETCDVLDSQTRSSRFIIK